MKKAEEEFELRFRPRAMETVPVEISKDALESLKRVAAIRDMSYQALLKFYVGQGLRQDLHELFQQQSGFEKGLALMAADPQIQLELKTISDESA